MMHWGLEYGMGFGWIFMLIFWGLVIVGIVAIIRSMAGKDNSAGPEDESAEDILRKRFARGEISADELRQGLEVLKQIRS